MKTKLLLLFSIFGSQFFYAHFAHYRNCDANKCYRSVNTTYADLVELIKLFENKTINAKLPTYDDSKLKSLTKQFNTLDKDFLKLVNNLNKSNRRLDATKKNGTENQKLIEELIKKFENIGDTNISLFIDILHELEDKHKYFNEVLKLQLNITEECGKAKKEYDNFEDVVKNLFREFGDISKEAVDKSNFIEKLNKEVRKTNSETVKLEKQASNLKIPVEFVDNYIKDLERKFNSTYKKLVKNKKILEELIKNMDDNIRKNFDNVSQIVNQLQDDLKIMKDILKAYIDSIPEFPEADLPPVDELLQKAGEMKKRIEKFSAEFDKIRKRFINKKDKNINYLKGKLLDIQNERTKIQEYLLFLETIPLTEKQMEVVKDEIWKNQETFRLMSEKAELQIEYNNLKKICEEIDKYKKCPVNIQVEN